MLRTALGHFDKAMSVAKVGAVVAMLVSCALLQRVERDVVDCAKTAYKELIADAHAFVRGNVTLPASLTDGGQILSQAGACAVAHVASDLGWAVCDAISGICHPSPPPPQGPPQGASLMMCVAGEVAPQKAHQALSAYFAVGGKSLTNYGR